MKEQFIQAYIQHAKYWSGIDDTTPALKTLDIAEDSMRKIRDDCVLFLGKNTGALQLVQRICNDSRIALDFFKTRNLQSGFDAHVHGIKPIDRAFKTLYLSAREFGEQQLYVGDDGQIHVNF